MQNIADNFLNTYSSRCYKGVEGIKTIHIFMLNFPIILFIFLLLFH